MARKFAQLHVASSDDPDVEELTIEAQWLYFKVLLGHPMLSSCGVMDWRPKHLVRKGKNGSLVKILAAAAELEAARFLMFDLETEEVFMRSLVRRDELLKNPKMAGAVVKAYHAVASRELQAALVTEVKRVREEFPDYSSWSHKDTKDDLARILSRPDLAAVGYTNAFSDQITYGITDVRPNEITNPDPVDNGYLEAVDNGDPGSVPDGDVVPEADNPAVSVRIPSTSTNTHNQHHSGGYVTGEPHVGAGTANDPPPRTCPEHPHGTAEACAACGIFRRNRDAFDAEAKRQATQARAAEREADAEVRRQAIANCPLGCGNSDDPGYLNGRVCDHDPDTADRARRGMAQIRAAMAKKASAPTDPTEPVSAPSGPPESASPIEDHTQEKAHA